MTRAGATIAMTMPAMAPPDKDLGILGIVDCELAELELDDILSAVTVMVATGVFAGVPETVKLGKVESEVEVEVDEGPCESKSAFTIASTRNRDLNILPAMTRTATDQAPQAAHSTYHSYQSKRTNDSHSEQWSSPESVHPYHRYPISAYSLATYSLL